MPRHTRTHAGTTAVAVLACAVLVAALPGRAGAQHGAVIQTSCTSLRRCAGTCSIAEVPCGTSQFLCTPPIILGTCVPGPLCTTAADCGPVDPITNPAWCIGGPDAGAVQCTAPSTLGCLLAGDCSTCIPAEEANPKDTLTCETLVTSIDSFLDPLAVSSLTATIFHASPRTVDLLDPGSAVLFGQCSFPFGKRCSSDLACTPLGTCSLKQQCVNPNVRPFPTLGSACVGSGRSTCQVGEVCAVILPGTGDLFGALFTDVVHFGEDPLRSEAAGEVLDVNEGLSVGLTGPSRVHVLTPSCADGCDDGFVCNGQETCVAGTCTGGTPLACGVCETCTDAGCQPVTPCCGNGVVEDGEQCDQGAAHNGQDGVCCGAACAFRPGVVCGPAPSTCVRDAICTSESDACPANVLSSGDTACRDGDPCTLEDRCVDGTCQPGTRVCDATADLVGKGTKSTPPSNILVTCTGQPREGEEAACAAGAFVHVGGAPGIAQRFTPLLRTGVRCRPDANGNVSLTDGRRLPLTADEATNIPLHLNKCLKILYNRLRRGQRLTVDVPVALSGVESDVDTPKADALLQRVVTIVRGGRR